MTFEIVCTVAILAIGLVTCIALRPRLGAAVLPLGGLFVLASNEGLPLVKACAWRVLQGLEHADTIRHSRILASVWYYSWSSLPVLLAGVFGWALWKELRRVPPVPGQPPDNHGLTG